MVTKPGFLPVFGMVTLNGSKVKTARVNVYDGNQLAMEVATSKKGEFVTELALNKHYTLEFMADGAVTKRIAINTYVENKNAAPVPFDCFVNLVHMEQVAGKDISTLDFPVAMVKYNEKKRAFEPQLGYSMNMMKEYNKALDSAQGN
jgi:hypothetical protein